MKDQRPKLYPGCSFMVCVGKWGGIKRDGKLPHFRLVLGFVAIHFMLYDFDTALGTLILEVERERNERMKGGE